MHTRTRPFCQQFTLLPTPHTHSHPFLFFALSPPPHPSFATDAERVDWWLGAVVDAEVCADDDQCISSIIRWLFQVGAGWHGR